MSALRQPLQSQAPADGARPAPARLLLVEDHRAIAEFVGVVLEDQEVELHVASTLAAARAALATRPAMDAMLTDLMLPDGAAIDWLERDAPALPWAVLSAGLDDALAARFRAAGARAVLHKPVGVRVLLDCVQALLQAAAPAAPGTVRLEPQAAAPLPAAGREAPEPPEPQAWRDAIDAHFGGDAGLFAGFRRTTLARLHLDAEAGDAAQAAGDRAALRRVAHSLKSVLTLIGEPEAARLAAALEHSLNAAVHGVALAPAGVALNRADTEAWASLARQLRSWGQAPGA